MFITAAVLAEICSALPLSGSIYIWAAESAGPKRARFFGFLVAWWSTTAWMTFTAGNCQVCSSIRLPLPRSVPRPPPFSRESMLGNGELHCVTARCMGGRLSRWYRKRQHQMESIRLGCLRNDVVHIYCDQLPPPEMVQGRVPLLGLYPHARLFPLPHLAPDCRAQYVRVPFRKIRFYFDMYVLRNGIFLFFLAISCLLVANR